MVPTSGSGRAVVRGESARTRGAYRRCRGWISSDRRTQTASPPRPHFEAEVARRTLTNLYNLRPAWLTQAHEALDDAVAAADGWTDYVARTPDDEILRRLLA